MQALGRNQVLFVALPEDDLLGLETSSHVAEKLQTKSLKKSRGLWSTHGLKGGGGFIDPWAEDSRRRNRWNHFLALVDIGSLQYKCSFYIPF
jgi:hypothetical protein